MGPLLGQELKAHSRAADPLEMERVGENVSFFAALAVVALITGVIAVWLAVGVGGQMATLYADDLGTVAAVVAATILCLRAGLRLEGPMRRFWWLLAAACGAWALGEVIWAVYDLILHQDVPVPSWADIGYLTAIPLAVAALLFHPALHGRGVRVARGIFDGLVIATALLFLSWTLVLGPLWHETDLTTAGGVVALAYPFGDAVILFFIVLVVRALPKGENLALWCLLAGLLALALADSSYAYLTEVKNYGAGDILDVGWIVGYLGIALGAFCADRPSVVPRTNASVPSLTAFVAPFMPILVALIFISVEIELGHRPDQVALIVAFALVVLVLARQALLLADMVSQHGAPGSNRLERLRATVLASMPEAPSAEPSPRPKASGVE
jgi:hypothetical protein